MKTKKIAKYFDIFRRGKYYPEIHNPRKMLICLCKGIYVNECGLSNMIREKAQSSSFYFSNYCDLGIFITR